MNEEFDYKKIDEKKVTENMIQMFEDLKRRRDNYLKYGPLFILISGVVFLTLMFSLERKIVFLILWVISVIYCAALMIRSEYRYHECARILGLISEEDSENEQESKEDKQEVKEQETEETSEDK